MLACDRRPTRLLGTTEMAPTDDQDSENGASLPSSVFHFLRYVRGKLRVPSLSERIPMEDRYLSYTALSLPALAL
jgi:hypothetical protein